MTEILGLIQFLLIVYILFNEFKHKSSAVFLWATLFIMFGVMHLLASFGGDSEYSDSVLSKASLFVILFCAFYIVVRNTFGTKVLAENEELMSYESLIRKQNDENYDINILFVVFLIVFFAKVLPFLHYAGDIMSTSWGTGRGYTDSLNYVNSLQIIKIFFYALSGVTVCFWLRKNYLIMSTIVALSLFDVLLTRNRIEILPIACSLIAIFIFKNKRISFKVVILGAVLSVLVVYMVYGLRVFRHYGTLQTFINNFNLTDFNNRVRTYLETGNGELGLRKTFYYFIQNDNNFDGFGKGHTYIRMLLVYIPTSWSFGLKPSDFAIAMGAARGYAEGVSTHPTLFGDCYANLGVLGVLLGIFWAFYCNLVDYVTKKQNNSVSTLLMFVLNAVVFVIIGRGSVYNGFWFAAYGIPLIIFATYCKNHIKIRLD